MGVSRLEGCRLLFGVLEGDGDFLDGVRGIASLLPLGENWWRGEARMCRERGVLGERRDAFCGVVRDVFTGVLN